MCGSRDCGISRRDIDNLLRWFDIASYARHRLPWRRRWRRWRRIRDDPARIAECDHASFGREPVIDGIDDGLGCNAIRNLERWNIRPRGFGLGACDCTRRGRRRFRQRNNLYEFHRRSRRGQFVRGQKRRDHRRRHRKDVNKDRDGYRAGPHKPPLRRPRRRGPVTTLDPERCPLFRFGQTQRSRPECRQA